MALLVRSEGGLRGGKQRGTGELGARPWRSHALAPNGAGRGSRRASEGERAARPSFRRAQGRDRADHAARKLGNGGHVHGHTASFEAFY